MRGRLLLPVVVVFGWGAFGAAACSASKEPGGITQNHGGTTSTAGVGLGGDLINTGGSSGGSINISGSDGTGGSMAPLPPHTMCSGDIACGMGLTCVKGKGEPDHCAPTGKACTMDSECGGDSYCCGEGCLFAAGDSVCIPYGYGPRGNINDECKGEGAPPGVFAPSVQCEWKVQPTDPHPMSGLVLATPMVADLPNDSGASAEIVFVSFAAGDGDGSISTPGVIRIVSGQTCELKETVEASSGIVRAGSPLALADLDGDGKIEIVARKDAMANQPGGLVMFGWDGAKYVKKWESSLMATAEPYAQPALGQGWDGPSIHDLNDDGIPEVLAWGEVYDSRTGVGTGKLISKAFNGTIPVAGDFNGDGKADLAGTLYQEATYLSWIGQAWVDQAVPLNTHWGHFASHFAIADFGTPGATAADFDPKKLDGIAEVVTTNAEQGGGRVSIFTLSGQEVMGVQTTIEPGVVVDAGNESGGPPTIGDFDNDGFPEVAIAGATRFRVFDFDCKNGGAGCEGPFVRWSQRSQDASSRQTAASIFDFDGDGKAEAVYADECFLRVYDGTNGDVLFSSFRTSGTWYENPVIADVDKDDNTEIVVNSAYAILCPHKEEGGELNKAFVDPLHKGVRCDDDMGCPGGGMCMDGYCRCTDNAQCDAGTTCVAALAGTPGTGKVCRATHPNTMDTAGGVKVLRDRLDRWASSRPMWNQHAYSITNVEDDGKIPKTSDWMQNWKVKGLNNYRANVQGKTGFADYPDITGALYADKVCSVGTGGVTLTATVCNRGKKAVGADMPATFYAGDPAQKMILCTSYTKGPVPVGGCLDVSCDVNGSVLGTVTMVVNDDGKGGMTTVECNSDNNTDSVVVKDCVPK
ncbi:MAG TPA: VCBS repeat-containing protein [Polyangiaceae bacterium]|nr:VCBS repeat-containing protein [Polyangiaceae bacterium]